MQVTHHDKTSCTHLCPRTAVDRSSPNTLGTKHTFLCQKTGTYSNIVFLGYNPRVFLAWLALGTIYNQ